MGMNMNKPPKPAIPSLLTLRCDLRSFDDLYNLLESLEKEGIRIKGETASHWKERIIEYLKAKPVENDKGVKGPASVRITKENDLRALVVSLAQKILESFNISFGKLLPRNIAEKLGLKADYIVSKIDIWDARVYLTEIKGEAGVETVALNYKEKSFAQIFGIE